MAISDRREDLPVIVAADWFGRSSANPRKLNPGERPDAEPLLPEEPDESDQLDQSDQPSDPA